jgi:hypothetical protein
MNFSSIGNKIRRIAALVIGADQIFFLTPVGQYHSLVRFCFKVSLFCSMLGRVKLHWFHSKKPEPVLVNGEKPRIFVLHTFSRRHLLTLPSWLAVDIDASDTVVITLDDFADSFFLEGPYRRISLRLSSLRPDEEERTNEKIQQFVAIFLEHLKKVNWRGKPFGHSLRWHVHDRILKALRISCLLEEILESDAQQILIVKQHYDDAIFDAAMLAQFWVGPENVTRLEGGLRDWRLAPGTGTIPKHSWFNEAWLRNIAAWIGGCVKGNAKHSAGTVVTGPILVASECLPESIYWSGLEPAIRAIERRGASLIWAGAMGEAGRILQNPGHKIFTHTLNGLSFDPDDMALLQRFDAHLRSLPQAGKFKDFEPVFTTLAHCLSESPRLYGEARVALDWIYKLNQIFEAEKPKIALILPHSSPQASQTELVCWAHGVATTSFPCVTVAPRKSAIVDWSSDFIFSYGTQCSESFQALGYKSTQLIEVGNPAMDKLYGLDRTQALQAVGRHLGVALPVKIVVIATSGVDPDEMDWVRHVANSFAEDIDIAILYRPHPDNPPPHKTILNKYEGRFFYIPGLSIDTLIGVADVFVTDLSTVGAEAFIAGKALITVNLTGAAFRFNRWDDYGIAEGVFKREDIALKIRSCLKYNCTVSAGSRKKFTRMFNTDDDGRAAERISRALESIATKGSPGR